MDRDQGHFVAIVEAGLNLLPELIMYGEGVREVRYGITCQSHVTLCVVQNPHMHLLFITVPALSISYGLDSSLTGLANIALTQRGSLVGGVVRHDVRHYLEKEPQYLMTVR